MFLTSSIDIDNRMSQRKHSQCMESFATMSLWYATHSFLANVTFKLNAIYFLDNLDIIQSQ